MAQLKEKFDDTIIKLFNKSKKYLERFDDIIVQEIPLYSKYLKIAGRVDCIAYFDGELSVIDFKTSTNIKKEDQIQDYFLHQM